MHSFYPVMRLTKKNVLPLALIVSSLLLSSSWRIANAATVTLRCTNPSSGATWDIKIDYQNSTADLFPAEIKVESIKWYDVLHGGHYEFDRASGDLTVIFASSTGGFTIKDKCHFI
jgi:hypothetical protein